MLYKVREQPASARESGTIAGASDQFDLRWMISAVLQHRWLIIALPLVFMAFAVVFVLLRPSSYTASTQLQLTNLRLTFSREDTFFAETHPDPTFLETQLQIVRSDRVALRVLLSLQLLTAEATVDQKAEALERVRRGFAADRAGLSNVVQIFYTARDPEMAARVANEFTQAYIAEQNAARLDAAQSGSSWLRDRLREVGPKARVIAEALPPPHKSNMRGMLIIASAGVMGGLLAVAGAILWRSLDRRVVTPEEATAVAGAECLGIIPCLPPTATSLESHETDKRLTGNSFSADSLLLTYALAPPVSEAWHTLRNVTAACQDCFGGKGLRYLGVTSTFAGEGRSTLAANLALAIACSNKRVLLVDGDIYDPALSRQFASEERPGLMEYLRSEKDVLARYVLVERRTGLHFLSIGGGAGKQVDNIWTDGLRGFFEETISAYDYVIFDMPTLGVAGDIRAAARYIDGFLLVIGWQQVSAESVRVGLSAVGAAHERLLGTVLNNLNAGEARWALSPQIAFSRQQTNFSRSAGDIVRRAAGRVPQLDRKIPRLKRWLLKVLLMALVAATVIATFHYVGSSFTGMLGTVAHDTP